MIFQFIHSLQSQFPFPQLLETEKTTTRMVRIKPSNKYSRRSRIALSSKNKREPESTMFLLLSFPTLCSLLLVGLI